MCGYLDIEYEDRYWQKIKTGRRLTSLLSGGFLAGERPRLWLSKLETPVPEPCGFEQAV